MLGILNFKMQERKSQIKVHFFPKIFMRMAIVKIHCASLATNKFSVVGVLHMLNWKRPGISPAKQYVGEKKSSKEALYI